MSIVRVRSAVVHHPHSVCARPTELTGTWQDARPFGRHESTKEDEL